MGPLFYHNKTKDVLEKRDAELKIINELREKVSHELLWHLQEQVYKFYEPQLVELKIQFEAVQAYQLTNERN